MSEEISEVPAKTAAAFFFFFFARYNRRTRTVLIFQE